MSPWSDGRRTVTPECDEGPTSHGKVSWCNDVLLQQETPSRPHPQRHCTGGGGGKHQPFLVDRGRTTSTDDESETVVNALSVAQSQIIAWRVGQPEVALGGNGSRRNKQGFDFR